MASNEMRITSPRKRVSAKVVEDDVVESIVHIKKRSKSLLVRTMIGLRRRKSPSPRKSEILPKCDDDETQEHVQRSYSLEAAEDDITGKDVFVFKTPKRQGQMAEKAAKESSKKIASNRKSKKVMGESIKTPSRSPSKDRHKCKAVSEENGGQNGQTPYNFRRRIANKLSKLVVEEASSSEKDSESSSQENDSENSPSDGAMADSVTKIKKRGKNKVLDASKSAAERYFHAHETSTPGTSDRMLSRLQIPCLDRKTIANVLAQSPKHQVRCSALLEQHKALFDKWKFQLRCGFNLLLYGLGSKRLLLQEFKDTLLEEYHSVIINGFFPSITLKQILNCITDEILDSHETFQNTTEHLNFIQKTLSAVGSNLILIIHNIDGCLLRLDKVQSALQQLAQMKEVHIVATIDHINALLMWDQSRVSAFNWLWYDVTTLRPYTAEIAHENSLLVQQAQTLALSSLNHVFQSLTSNAKGIFLLLAKHQLSQRNNSEYIGLPFHDFYQNCREAFLVNSELTLKSQLTEFRDHKLLISKKSPDSIECLLIPLDEEMLLEFIDSLE